jgi:hypothetical protein
MSDKHANEPVLEREAVLRSLHDIRKVELGLPKMCDAIAIFQRK